MKVLVCIPSFGTEQHEYLKAVCENFMSYDPDKYDMHIVVHATDDPPEGVTAHEWLICDRELKEDLAWQHRHMFKSRRDDYDLYIYCEDDMIIPQKSIDMYIEFDKIHGPNICAGFIRYEINNDGEVCLVDLSEDYPPVIEASFLWKKYDDIVVSVPYNKHQGCCILTAEQLNICINNAAPLTPFDHSWSFGFYGSLETAASGLFYSGFLNKCIARNNLEDSMIWHMPNKYVNEQERDSWIKISEMNRYFNKASAIQEASPHE